MLPLTKAYSCSNPCGTETMNHEWLEQDSATQNVAGDLTNRTIVLGTKVQLFDGCCCHLRS